MIRTIKNILRPIRDYFRTILINRKMVIRKNRIFDINKNNFNFYKFKTEINNFINLNKVGDKHFSYTYAESCTQPTLYASTYAAMTSSLLGDMHKFNQSEKDTWQQYFDSYQNKEDGLFYDPVVQNNIYNDSDWWGARHLALHLVIAYTGLGCRPKYQFSFLKKYYSPASIQDWLDQFDWEGVAIGESDIDNKIMNIGCLLQYQRDFWDDADAGYAVDYLKYYLRKKINSSTGMWGGFDVNEPNQRSRMVQFAYHLFLIYFYDNDYDFDVERIIDITLKTKNELHGFGVKLNSSACEDIDSVDILIRLHQFASPQTKIAIISSIEKTLSWIMFNKVDDGGFVFRLDERFGYGHVETASKKNEGAMFPTWFRTLSIAYISNFLNIKNDFHIQNCPGYEFTEKVSDSE